MQRPYFGSFFFWPFSSAHAFSTLSSVHFSTRSFIRLFIRSFVCSFVRSLFCSFLVRLNIKQTFSSSSLTYFLRRNVLRLRDLERDFQNQKAKSTEYKKLSLTLKDDLRRFKLNRNRLSRHYLNNNPIFWGAEEGFPDRTF